MTPDRRRTLNLRTCVVVVATVLAVPARAACIVDEPLLLWSLPASGATDVPANAKLWFLTSLGTQDVRVEVDGIPASTTDIREMFDPGPLVPGAHVVTVRGSVRRGDVALLARFTFESTAETVSSPTEGPTIAAVQRTELLPLPGFCNEARAAIDCFDVGEPTEFIAETATAADGYLVTASDNTGRILQEVVWPGECPSPRAVTATDTQPCIELATIGYDGVSPNGPIVCDVADDDVGGDNDDEGCTTTPPPLALALGVLLIARRRRRRADHLS